MNLKDIKLGKHTSEKPKLAEVPLGFSEIDGVEVGVSRIKRNIHKMNAELKASGAFSNVWLCNIVFFNISLIIIFISLAYNFKEKLSGTVGLNLDDISRLDTPIPQHFLLYLLPLHIALIIGTIGFAFKHHKRISHLFVLAVGYYLVLGVFEIIALKELLVYFT